MKAVCYGGTGMNWFLADDIDPEVLGFMPTFFTIEDPRPAREQIAERYVSGWMPMPSGKFSFGENGALLYPGDPPLRLLAVSQLRDEELRFYDYSWLAIVQSDGSFEVARVD